LPAALGKHQHHRSLICNYCFKAVGNPEALRNHAEICTFTNSQRVTFPKEDNYKFSKLHMYENVPFKIFFSFQYAVNDANNDTENVKALLSVISYTAILVGPREKKHNQMIDQFYYDQEQPVEHFLKLIFKLSQKIESLVQNTNVPMELTNLENLHHHLAIKCELCQEDFSTELQKHRDHDHFTGEFRYDY